MLLNSSDVRNRIYFESHAPGTVDLVINHDIRHADGPITLSAAAAEDLLINLEVNASFARAMGEKI